MSTVYLASDEQEQEFPDAGEWEAGVAVRVPDGTVGLGFFLFDAQGKPLAGCCMSPEQALKQGLYLVENATRMIGCTLAISARAVIEENAARITKEVVDQLERHGARPAD